MNAKMYKLIVPEEPPIGSRVKTESGLVFRRSENNANYWFPYPGGGHGCTWALLLERYGELTDVTPMRTWELPAEPPIGTKGRDAEGDIWTRGEDGLWRVRERSGASWGDVLSYGTFTEVR